MPDREWSVVKEEHASRFDRVAFGAAPVREFDPMAEGGVPVAQKEASSGQENAPWQVVSEENPAAPEQPRLKGKLPETSRSDFDAFMADGTASPLPEIERAISARAQQTESASAACCSRSTAGTMREVWKLNQVAEKHGSEDEKIINRVLDRKRDAMFRKEKGADVESAEGAATE